MSKYPLINPSGFFATNQQARSQGTIMFKVIPITERPVHNQTMVNHPHTHTHTHTHTALTLLSPALREAHGGLQPPAGPGHPLRRRWDELQKRRHPGDRGPDRRPLVAGQETAQQRGMRRPRPVGQLAETVKRLMGDIMRGERVLYNPDALL